MPGTRTLRHGLRGRLGLIGGGGAVPFDPLSLFANGEDGWLFDASVISSLAKNSAGSTPVTADNDVVGRTADLSGNGNHRTQALNDSFKPTYQTDGTLHWLEASGTFQFLQMADPAISQPMTIMMAMRQIVHATNDRIFLSPTPGTRLMQNGTGGAGRIGIFAGGAAEINVIAPVDEDFVVTMVFNGAGSSIAVDNESPVTGSSAGTAGLAATNFFATNDSSGYTNMREYASLCVNRLLTENEKQEARLYLAVKAGVTFS